MSSEGRGLTKWQVAALGVGAVAIVAGGALVAYACVKRRGRKSLKEGDREGAPEGESARSGAENQPSTAASGHPASQPENALDRARAIKQQGNEFYKQQKFEEAIRCYEEAIKVCPAEKKEDIAIFHQNIGAVYDQMASKATDKDQKTSNLHSVIDSCTASLTLNPRYIKALTRRMKAHHSLGNNEEALMDITRACLLDESQGRFFADVLPVILKEIGKKKAKEMFPKLGPLAPTRNMVKSYFESFEWIDDLSDARLRVLWVQQRSKSDKSKPQDGESAESGDTEGASEETAEGSQKNGEEGESGEAEVNLYEGFDEEPFVRAAAQFNSDNYHGILELLTEAVDGGRSVFVPHALLLRGTLYALWREDEKALKDLQEVVNTQEQDKQMCVSALVRRAGIFAGSGEMEKCNTCLDKALAIDSNAADIFIHRARILLESAEGPAQLSTCIEDLEKAIKKAPNSAHAVYSLASAFHRMAGMTQSMQTLEQAKAKFEEARGKFPNFVDGLILHALFLQDFSQFGEAEDLLNKAIKMAPDNPLSHFSLGLLNIVKSGQIAGGMKHMEKAVEVDCSCVQAYDTIAAYEMQKGNMDRAIELYSKAMQNSRSFVELSQTITSREVVVAQNKACKEYGISAADLVSRSLPMGGPDSFAM